jgi:hypothetical protein
MPDPGHIAHFKMKKDVTTIISQAVVETVQVMFGQHIEVLRTARPVEADTVSVRVLLLQDEMCVVFRFAFERSLLVKLISSFYPSDAQQDDLPYEDGASEIANIVCNRVKKFLNQQGYNLVMHLPEIEREGGLPREPGVINLNFTMDSSNRLNVDFDITTNRVAF